MSKLICPFCKKELKLIGEKSDSGYPIDEYFCGCPQTTFHFGNAPMWNELRVLHDDLEERREYSKRAKKELIRTRKALEIAVDALDRMAIYDSIYDIIARNAMKRIKELEQITSLGQKESAFVHNKIEFPEFNDNLLEEFDKQFFENGQDDDLTETALEQKD